MIIGSLVLSSNSSPRPYLGLGEETGHHVPSRTNGVWWVNASDMNRDILYLPQRDKRSTVFSTSKDPAFQSRLLASLGELDSKFPALTQLKKYQLLQEQELGTDPYLAVVNTEGEHGSWSFLSRDIPIYFYGVWDGISIQLMWADWDIGPALRSVAYRRLWLYRFPVIERRPVFIRTQSACSKWWKWVSQDHPNDFLRCFNALEIFLFGLGTHL